MVTAGNSASLIALLDETTIGAVLKEKFRFSSVPLNEAINNAQTEYNQCISRQDKLYKSLTVNRSKRIEEKRNENASILNLVYAWKQEENRERMIALAERQREALKEEVEKLSSVDEFKAIIRGIDPKEIFNT